MTQPEHEEGNANSCWEQGEQLRAAKEIFLPQLHEHRRDSDNDKRVTRPWWNPSENRFSFFLAQLSALDLSMNNTWPNVQKRRTDKYGNNAAKNCD